MIKRLNNVDLDIPVVGVYGWVTPDLVSFVSEDLAHVVTFIDMGDYDSVLVTEISKPKNTTTLREVIEESNTCEPDEVVRVLMDSSDYVIKL